MQYFAGILKPSDQYPCEPGVLKSNSNSRPLSALSNGGVFMGNLAPRNEVENEASETEETSTATKVGTLFLWVTVASLQIELLYRPIFSNLLWRAISYYRVGNKFRTTFVYIFCFGYVMAYAYKTKTNCAF